MNECKLCHRQEKGSVSPDNWLIKETVDLNITSMNFWAVLDPDKSALSVHINADPIYQDVLQKYILINFCPMCGRKLNSQ